MSVDIFQEFIDHLPFIFEMCLFSFLIHLLIELLDFLVFFILCIFVYIYPLLRCISCKDAFHSVGYSFTQLAISFSVQKLFSLTKSLWILGIISRANEVPLRQVLSISISWNISPYFFRMHYLTFGVFDLFGVDFCERER